MTVDPDLGGVMIMLIAHLSQGLYRSPMEPVRGIVRCIAEELSKHSEAPNSRSGAVTNTNQSIRRLCSSRGQAELTNLECQ